eukprot:Ihof_evm1s172 gene=Ihof_evmTU1s172
MPSETMKGLKKFIIDLRNCKSKEAETQRCNKELANIRKQFKGDSKNLDGYQKKKYVCKLVYIYLLGYDIDFGHMEAVSLLSSAKFSEKHVGYLFISVLLHENCDLVRLLIQSIKNDLVARFEINSCLALTCVANIGGREMAETLGNEVQSLLVSGDSSSFIKKKAALALLRLYRKSPDILPVGEWSHRVVKLLDERDLGVVMSVLSLMQGLVAEHGEAYAHCIPKAINRLKKILFNEETLDEYYYYKVPAPWVQVKTLRLVQMYSPPEEGETRRVLIECLNRILSNSDLVKTTQTNNARQAVLFEAINVAIHLEVEVELVITAANLLGKLISAKETNTRYMALEAMTNLCAIEYAHEHINRNLNTIIQALKFERDISVRRRALDLLFHMCKQFNSTVIITALVGFLEHAEYAMREEMVLKIAILAERYTTDYSFYVDVVLSLIRIAGDYINDEVWYRVIQIVTNRDDIQEYSTQTCFNALCNPACHESMVKVGGYILGEFGDLIANDPASGPSQQFQVLHSKFHTVSLETRCLLLSTYVKFINLFPELKDTILEVLRSPYIARNTNAELQQRAVEYLNLVSNSKEDVLVTVLDQMPPYPERESSILAKLKKRDGFVTDKARNKDNVASQSKASDSSNADEATNNKSAITTANQDTNKANLLGDLMDQSPNMDYGPPPTEPSAGTEKWLYNLVSSNAGILFEDANLQVGVKDEYRNNLGRMALYYTNKSAYPMTNIKTRLCDSKTASGLRLDVKACPTSLSVGQQQHQVIQCEGLGVFDSFALMDFFYTVNTVNTRITLALPIFISKFAQPFPMTKGDFSSRWAQLGGPDLESQISFAAVKPMEDILTKKKIEGMGLTVLLGIDPNPINYVAACVIHVAGSQMGCLMRLEPNMAAK